MSPDRPHRPLVLLVALAVLAALLPGCDGGDSPTEPRRVTPPAPLPAPTSTPAPSWTALWSFDAAEPAGDCLVDALNDFRADGGMRDWPFALTVERQGDAIRLVFHGGGNGWSEGFWPVVFAGTVEADGRVSAEVPASAIGGERTDPWLELCYWSWSMQGGELTAVQTADGRRLEGTIVERFRVSPAEGGATFTVHSRFTAIAR